MDSKDIKRVTIFAGHYGSGKTNLAVNYALEIKKLGKAVSIADLDIVNPYFRTKDAGDVLEVNGIRLISSIMANTNVDTPALPADAYSIVNDTDKYAVVDVGGDDRGALALGRYVGGIIDEGNYEFLFVINKYRYLTRDAEGALAVMREIEESASLKFTGIVNNSNLGDETDSQTIRDSLDYMKKISEISGLPVRFIGAREDIASCLENFGYDIFPIKIYVKQSF